MGDVEEMESSIGLDEVLRAPGLSKAMKTRVQQADKNAGALHFEPRTVPALPCPALPFRPQYASATSMACR
jgi:hypothetical protein